MLTVCLDPGHGGSEPGAVRDGLREADLTLRIALAAGRHLRRRYRVVLTREADKTVSLDQRRATAEGARADLFVSIHINSAGDARARGYEVFVRREPSPESLMLAPAMLVQFSRRWSDRPNRGLKHANFTVLLQPRPACLVECFFISNPAERNMLTGQKAIAQLGEAIAWGCGNSARAILKPTGL